MNVVSGKFWAGLAAGSLTLLTTASGIASPSLLATASETTGSVAPAPSPYLWSAAAVAELQQEALSAAQEGLDPAAYDPSALTRILGTQGESAALDAAAKRTALALAQDYAHGRVGDRGRIDWHIEPSTRSDLAAELDKAVRSNQLRAWLRSLLPSDPRYAALRTALAATAPGDVAMRDRLRANLERWRWMPRSLGADHIYVNVPSYSLRVVDDGQLVSTYTVVVGKPSTPTPQMMAQAKSIVVNPWWNVPTSIARSMRSSKGFVTKAGGGFAQPPGPRNALGKVKIDMPNPHSIYLHDTPSKALFAESSRAYSHGCIRVKDIDRLAAELAVLDRGNDAPVRQALARSSTQTLPLQATRPVYLVYFTMDVGHDGQMMQLEDPYNRDKQLIASLDNATRLALSAPAKIKKW